MAHRVGVW